jgi:hypothetical protein
MATNSHALKIHPTRNIHDLQLEMEGFPVYRNTQPWNAPVIICSKKHRDTDKITEQWPK